MQLNDLLEKEGLNPEKVLVLRHRPHEKRLNRVLPWLAVERHDLFNAYQSTQQPRVESAFKKLQEDGYIASFIGLEPKRALFVGVYHIGASRALDYEGFWKVPAYREMKQYGIKGWTHEEKEKRKEILYFDLRPIDFYSQWKGRLLIEWPSREISWWRRAHKNVMKVIAIHEDSRFEKAMPDWNELNLTSQELQVLPRGWREKLAQWRGVYFILDSSDGKGYVGSAYGKDNILGRWQNYAQTGHGGNRKLRKRDPADFRFSILQRVSPDLEPQAVIDLEASWKERLHTREYGLNDN